VLRRHCSMLCAEQRVSLLCLKTPATCADELKNVCVALRGVLPHTHITASRTAAPLQQTWRRDRLCRCLCRRRARWNCRAWRRRAARPGAPSRAKPSVVHLLLFSFLGPALLPGVLTCTSVGGVLGRRFSACGGALAWCGITRGGCFLLL